MTAAKEMTAAEHAQTAREFLAASDREFAAGDHLQGSEKLHGAATQAIIAICQLTPAALLANGDDGLGSRAVEFLRALQMISGGELPVGGRQELAGRLRVLFR